ncbi:hypothetical protein AO1008_01263 [Aspergillus oryzae 100-8]|nr:hypothetical protein AO1008_01263 [Aspergillus oryzae 100-8]
MDDQDEVDKELLRTFIPRVTRIHARIRTTQSSQCPEPTNDVFKEEKRRPFPYHPFGAAASYSDVADSEGHRLQTLWETFAQEASSS